MVSCSVVLSIVMYNFVSPDVLGNVVIEASSVRESMHGSRVMELKQIPSVLTGSYNDFRRPETQSQYAVAKA